MHAKFKKISNPIAIILLFILVDILCENFIGLVYSEQTKIQDLFLLFGFMLMQIIFAPIQSGFSDYFGRKKSLVFSLGCSLFSLVILLIYYVKIVPSFILLLLIMLIKGIFGNTLPLSLAAIADTQNKNYRFSFALSSGTYAIAYLVLLSAENIISNLIWPILFLIILFLFTVLVSLFIFKDKEDATSLKSVETTNPLVAKKVPSFFSLFKKEDSLILKDLKHKPTRNALIAFLLWEVSIYSILISQLDFQVNKATHIGEWMMLGYLAGVIFLKFSTRAKDSTIIKSGFYISFFSLTIYFIAYPFLKDMSYLLKFCYFTHTFGNAFLSSSLLAILAKQRKPHQQGKIYGLVDSFDTIAFLLGTIAIMIYTYLGLDPIWMLAFSFLVFAPSYFFMRELQEDQKLV